MSKTGYDPFCPRQEPARSIYEAFRSEATQRRQRAVDVWIRAELDVVHRTAAHMAPAYGLRPPTVAEVEAAERLARGHADYGAKWSLSVVERMRRPAPAPKEDR